MINSIDKIAAVFGGGNTPKDDPIFELAESIGKALARAGFTVANGGYSGTMLASAKGAAAAGGKVIGVTCKAFRNSIPNEYITETVATENLHDRLNTLVDIADAYVVLPGGTGTLMELAHVWEFKNKRFLNPGKPVIIAGNFWQPLVDLLESADPGCSACIETADTPEKILKILNSNLY